MAELDGPSRQLRLLVDHRDDLVAERTRIQSRLRWHLHELFPGLAIPPRALSRLHVLDQLDDRLSAVDCTVGLIARELVARCRALTLRISQLEREITQLVSQISPTLLALPGLRRRVRQCLTPASVTSGPSPTRSRRRHATETSIGCSLSWTPRSWFDGGEARPSLTSLVRGARCAAERAMSFHPLANTTTKVLVNGTPGGVTWTPDGSPFSIVALTMIMGGRIVEIDVLADPDRLGRLDLTALAG